MLYNGQRISKKKSHVKKRTLSPVYNESFVFELPNTSEQDLDNVQFKIVAMDWDRLTKNEVHFFIILNCSGYTRVPAFFVLIAIGGVVLLPVAAEELPFVTNATMANLSGLLGLSARDLRCH